MQGPQRAIGVGWQVAVRSRCVRGSSDERVESVSFAHHPVCETGGTQVTVSLPNPTKNSRIFYVQQACRLTN